MSFVQDVAPYWLEGDDATPSYGRASFAYKAASEVNIDMESGDDVTILLKGPEWFRAIVQGRVGYVPASYVTLVSLAAVC